MSEFTRTCEQFLAATREHFFAADDIVSAHQRAGEDACEGASGDPSHRAHAGS